MRYAIMIEETEGGFAVQAPDLAISTFGSTLEAARRAAVAAIQANLDAYREAAMDVPPPQPLTRHLENPDFRDLLFAYVTLPEPVRLAA